MRRVDPAPTSVIATGVLAVLVTIGPAALGIWLLIEGINQRPHPRPSNGNWPEIFPEYLLVIGWGGLLLCFAVCTGSAAIGIWRKKLGAAAAFAALCILALAVLAILPPSDAGRGYMALHLLCAIFSTKAVFDLRGSSAERFDLPIGPPPIPPPLPDFNVVDDLPEDDA